MSAATNKALAQRWIEEVWNKGDLALIDELIAPNYTLHDPTRPGLQALPKPGGSLYSRQRGISPNFNAA